MKRQTILFSLLGKSIALFTLLLLCYPCLVAQITGTIIDAETEEPIIGASILISGTTKGTITDIDGNFSLEVKMGEVLIISYTGYASQSILVEAATNVEIRLVPGVIIEEVVVTGYSVDTRRKTPGSVSTIKPRDLQISPSGNVEQQLQGRVPGVTVITNGQPGTTSQVRVRGYGALGGNAPLYVVDGVPVPSIDFLAPGDIESTTVLKDATAASIYGSRAAGGVIVYTTKKGKKGKQKIKISYDGMLGFTNPGSGYPVMNPQDEADWIWTAVRNAALLSGQDPVFNHPQYGREDQPVLPDYLLVGPDAGVIGSIDLDDHIDLYNIDPDAGPIYQVIKANKEGTDWFDAITRNGLINRHQLGMSGGGEKSRYYVGFGYQNLEGILKHQQFDRYSFRVNTEFDILPYLRIGENIQGTYRATRLLLGEAGGLGLADGTTNSDNVIFSSYRTSPILPVFDEFGGYAGTAAPGFQSGNVLARINQRKDDRDFSTQAFGNIYLELEPIEGLIFRSSFGGQYISTNNRRYFKSVYWEAQSNLGTAFSQSSSYSAQWILTNTINYKKSMGFHNVDLLVGQEALDQGTGYTINGFGINPFSENTAFIGLSTVNSGVVGGSPVNGVRFSSYFTRLNYDFKDTYILSLILRRDGSSRFGSNNRFGTFPAFSAAWRLSAEKFMQGINFVEDLKIRGGYGIMGNSNNVDPNNQFSLFGTSLNASSYDIGGTNSSAAEGFYRTRIGNLSAKWEKAITSNIGIDALLFNGKLDVGIEFWRKETEDLLFRLPVTVQTGFFATAPFVNVGKMLNKGLDFILTTKGHLGAFYYQITLNGGFLSNEIVALAPSIENLPNRSTSYGSITPVLNQVGQPLSAFYGFEVQGLFRDQAEVDAAATQDGAAPGRFRYRDINADGLINLEDRTNLGSPIADFTGGLAFKLSYQNFELEFYSFASIGNEIYNLNRGIDFYPNDIGNAISERVKDSWTFDNRDTDIPIFENTSNFSTNTQSNSYYVEDGSYFRLQNITFSYLFPNTLLSRWNIEQLRLFAAVNNAFTITGYSGLDPSIAGETDTNFGVDRGNFPITRGFTFGVNVGF